MAVPPPRTVLLQIPRLHAKCRMLKQKRTHEKKNKKTHTFLSITRAKLIRWLLRSLYVRSHKCCCCNSVSSVLLFVLISGAAGKGAPKFQYNSEMNWSFILPTLQAPNSLRTTLYCISLHFLCRHHHIYTVFIILIIILIIVVIIAVVHVVCNIFSIQASADDATHSGDRQSMDMVCELIGSHPCRLDTYTKDRRAIKSCEIMGTIGT